jgi:hypothetical protein
MQAATMTRDLVMVDASVISSEVPWQLVRRIAFFALIAAGVGMTAWILGHFGVLAVYGLPAPFIRRVPTTAAA